MASSSTASAIRLADYIDEKVEAGDLRKDPAQAEAITSLDNLLTELRNPPLGNKASALGWLFAKRNNPPAGPRGIYLWGGVGRGKSMLMDAFFSLVPDTINGAPKKRVHFHAFMQDVHQRIHAWRQEQKTAKEKSADPILPLAKQMASEAKLLCFDEFSVTDVADAMILARLFGALFERGVTVIATSNVEPDALYTNGLNRSFFFPFIELIKTRMLVIELVSETDHRMEKIAGSDLYFVENPKGFNRLWSAMVGDKTETETELEVQGRVLKLERAAGGVARATFNDLCNKPLGARDYLTLAEHYHTLFIGDIPVMDHSDRNAIKRFIMLIDTLYEAQRVVVISAAAKPSALYPVEHGTEAFEFDRTVSRLHEMQSEQWLSRGSGLKA